jgi:hypothetical protein
MFETLRQNLLFDLDRAARDSPDTPAALRNSFHFRIEPTNAIGNIAGPVWGSALACSVSFASNPRRTPTQSDPRGLRRGPHSTTVGAKTNAQFPETIASISGACKDAD